MPNGIPSHDTISRVFARLDPIEFERCFRNWVKTIAKIVPGEVISIDGKTLRHSGDKGIGKKAIHTVNAWASEQRLVLGQVKVHEKTAWFKNSRFWVTKQQELSHLLMTTNVTR